MNEKSIPVADVGVIIGRFQVDELHEAHLKLIQTVINNHSKVIIFLGLSATKCTINNPLDFEARKQMILQSFPEINVLYIKDEPSDIRWGKRLDETIKDLIGPRQTVLLYGGREGFMEQYSGEFETYELKQTSFVSGRDIRKTISNKVKSSEDFRKGVIWATMNQWPKVYPTVDIAIFNDDYTDILLARKPNENMFRLVGGFVNPGETFETAARREVAEETGLEITDPQYIKSVVIDDWRYRSESSKITTALFISKKMFGIPKPQDDICELKFFKLSDINLDKTNFYELNIVEEHRYLLECVLKHVENIMTKEVVSIIKNDIKKMNKQGA